MLILMQTLVRGGEYTYPRRLQEFKPILSYHRRFNKGSERKPSQGPGAYHGNSHRHDVVLPPGGIYEAFQRDRKSADDARAIERQTQSNKQIEGLTKSSPTNGITY